jgi:hypothetical protein
MGGNDVSGCHCGQFSVGRGIGILNLKNTGCALGVPNTLCGEFAFDWACFEGQQPTRKCSQVVHIFIFNFIRIESWYRIVQSKLRRRGRIQQIFLAKKPLFGDTVWKVSSYFHNMDDDGIARLKAKIEFLQKIIHGFRNNSVPIVCKRATRQRL